MSRRLHIGLFVLAAVALVLAACAGGNEPAPAPPTQTAEAVEQDQQASALTGVSWTVQSFGGLSDSIPPVPDSFPAVGFMGERYSGYTGCSYFVGVYEVDGEKLGLDWPAITQGICENELLLKQDDVFVAGLNAAQTYRIEDDILTFYAVDDQLIMTLVPQEPVPFEGTVWQYKFSMDDQSVWLPAIPGTTITAQFEGDTISGSAGCNNYTGAVARDGNQMTIDSISVTEMACADPQGVMEQEQLYLEALQTTGSIREYARTFELFSTEMQPLMLFHAE